MKPSKIFKYIAAAFLIYSELEMLSQTLVSDFIEAMILPWLYLTTLLIFLVGSFRLRSFSSSRIAANGLIFGGPKWIYVLGGIVILMAIVCVPQSFEATEYAKAIGGQDFHKGINFFIRDGKYILVFDNIREVTISHAQYEKLNSLVAIFVCGIGSILSYVAFLIWTILDELESSVRRR